MLVDHNLPKLLLAGKARFSVRSKKTSNHFTYCIQAKEKIFFVSGLTGPDNLNHYSYFAHIFRNDPEIVHLGKKSKISYNSPIVNAFCWFWSNVVWKPTAPAGEWVEVFHQGCCLRCGRVLTVPESVESGLGPECSNKI